MSARSFAIAHAEGDMHSLTGGQRGVDLKLDARLRAGAAGVVRGDEIQLAQPSGDPDLGHAPKPTICE